MTRFKDKLSLVLPPHFLRILFAAVTILFLSGALLAPAFSQEDDLEQKKKEIEELEQELQRVRGEKQTLASTLRYINGKISLAEAEISKTESELQIVQRDIAELSVKIDDLDADLTEITDVLINRISDTYKRSRLNPMLILLSHDGLSQVLSYSKYLQSSQKNDRHILYQLETTRQDFDLQKTSKQEKQVELDALSATLQDQKQALARQQSEKQFLLENTQNDERRYQQLLQEARAQLAALSRFVTAQGGASILSGQTKCDDWGCYYNQRDSQWGNLGLGDSNYSVAEYGCLISSVSMVASHVGKDIKPSNIAANASAFVPSTGYLYHSFSANGVSVSLTSASKSILDSELEAGRPVIAGLYSGPDHFIVVLKKEGDDYIIHDPFVPQGANMKLSDNYSFAAISSLRLVSFN